MIHPHSSHTNNNNHLNHHHHLPFHRNNKHHHCQEDLFQSYSIFSSCDEDESSSGNDVKPLPSLTMSHRVMITQDVKMSDIRSQLISHKLLLTNLIKVNESEVRNLVRKTKQRIKKDDLLDEPGQTYLDKLLECSRNARISSKFPHNLMSIRKGICCFEDDVFKCDKPSLPFSRHCQRHILYNVDQLLFVRCTAKDNETLTQCCNPSLDVLADEPLCNHHWHMKSSSSPTTPSILAPSLIAKEDAFKANLIDSGKGKGKLQAGPGRAGKRSKKRRKLTGNGKGIPGGPIDNIDSSSFLSQDSSDSIFVNSENCDTSQVPLSAIKIEPNIDTSNSVNSESGQPNQPTCIVPTIPVTIPLQLQPQQTPQTHHLHHHQQTSQQHQPLHIPHAVSTSHLPNTRSTLDNLSVIPGTTLLLRSNQPSMTRSLTTAVPVVLPDTSRNGIISSHLDSVTSLAPSDEALVASLVAELPTLCAENGPEPEAPGFVDADLTDVLNKIPDDAFNDLFVDNLKNGDIPSKEESEALEQALAAVSKNVQYLSVAAAAVGGSRSAVNNTPRERITSVTPSTVMNGDSNYYSHSGQHQHQNHHHGTVNGELPQLSHHQPTSVNTSSLPQHQPTVPQPQQPPSSSLPSISQSQPSSISTHDLSSRSISSNSSLNLNENDILGLANNILTSLTTEQQQQLNGLIDGALASGTLTPPTIKSTLVSLSNLQQESESCETHL